MILAEIGTGAPDGRRRGIAASQHVVHNRSMLLSQLSAAFREMST